MVARDRSKHTLMRVTGYGKPSEDDIAEAIGGALSAVSVLCTDAHPPYAKFAYRRGIHHEPLNASK